MDQVLGVGHYQMQAQASCCEHSHVLVQVWDRERIRLELENSEVLFFFFSSCGSQFISQPPPLQQRVLAL